MDLVIDIRRLVLDALQDPSVRERLREMVQEVLKDGSLPGGDPLLDSREGAKLIGMTPAALRAAARRGTVKSEHIGRLLRFRRSALLAKRER